MLYRQRYSLQRPATCLHGSFVRCAFNYYYVLSTILMLSIFLLLHICTYIWFDIYFASICFFKYFIFIFSLCWHCRHYGKFFFSDTTFSLANFSCFSVVIYFGGSFWLPYSLFTFTIQHFSICSKTHICICIYVLLRMYVGEYF